MTVRTRTGNTTSESGRQLHTWNRAQETGGHMSSSRWTGRDVADIVAWIVAIIGVLAVVVMPSDVSIKIAAGVAVVAAFWAGRLMGRDDHA